MLYRIRDAARYYLLLNLVCITISALIAIGNASLASDYFTADDALRAATGGISACEWMVGWWLLPLIAVIRYRQISGTELPWLPEKPGAPYLLKEMFASGEIGYVSDDETPTSGSEPGFRPTVNIDGSPMCGSTDIHGNPYGVTSHY
ncbi:hypothetical protein [Paraburkholderia sp. J12]|uniref:hypothetical protein n=1 Tax=Paraburkholderia sp. J12 TaxID=2805432 RepID=UPI002ABDE4F8|nr:hypothetical protein [Paraburkholderia sp. J12]